MKNSAKKMEITLESLMPNMQGVLEYENILKNLGSRWEILTLLGQMSGTGTDMSKTREGFETLSSQLLASLAKETLKKVASEINSKAQVAVDIVIRNLFERTADIGFLATDDDIREFIKEQNKINYQILELSKDPNSEEKIKNKKSELESLKDRIVERFEEYVLKYSVYDNIILCDTDGNLLAQLSKNSKFKKTKDPLIKEAIDTSKEYVETLGHSDMEADKASSLLYSFRVTDPDTDTPLGVLSLSFKFEDEMCRIFSKLREGNDWLVLTLLDKDGVVIASSDKYQIPLGATLEKAIGCDYKISKFAGRNYVAKTCPTKGYQGYTGLGWYGHAMLPIEHAFEKNEASKLSNIAESVLEAVMDNKTLFSDELRDIPKQADMIQKELDRTVWNGNVRQSSNKRIVNTSFSKVLLWEVSNTGAKTKEIFENSIGNLHETVVSSILSDVEFQAALAIDIMDRNLYERANDCRWWALTSAFKEILSAKEASSSDFEKMSQILSYINSLYTVYTSLFVFDKNCKVVAVSQDSDRHLIGKTLSEEPIKQTLNIKDSQKYTVSPFVKSHIYGGEETYIYLASILSSSKNSDTVGGIGIVFDSKPQFEAMLSDALPLDEKGDPIRGSFGVYADRSKRIVSCTDKQICEKSFSSLPNEYFEIRNGQGASGIVDFGGTYYAVGARVSDGYREYKSDSDSYKNDIVALVFVPLGEVCAKEAKKEKPAKHLRVEVSHRFESENCTEIASFYIGDKWLGIRSELVVEAVNAKGLTLIPGANRMLSGRINYNNKTVDVLNLSHELGVTPKEIGEDTQIVVTKIDKDIEESDEPIKYFGILVDELGEIPEVPNSRIDSLHTVFGANDLLGDGIVKPENSGNETQMLVILDPRKLLEKLLKKS